MAKATISRFAAATAMLLGAAVVGSAGSDSGAVSASGNDYLQSFDTADSLDDMVFEIADGRSHPGDAKSFGGDHGLPGADGMCTAPEEQRLLSSGGGNYEIPMRFGNSAVRSSGLAYWCPNGGQHMMTSFDTSGYAHFDFRPKRTFTDVRKVCWDQNITDMGPGKWTEVAVVPLDVFRANGRRMDYTHPSRNGPKEPGSWGLKITDGVFKGGFHGDSQSSSVNQSTDSGKTNPSSTEDKRLRTQHCVSDNGNDTVTMSRGLSTGATQVDVLRGSLPLGESVVIFSDVSYNPDKRSGHEADENTWHWDNLFISSDSDTIAPTGGGAPPVSQPPVVPSKAGQFDPLPPARLFDSRAGESTVDGRFVGGGLRGQGSLTKVDVVGRGSVSSDVGAVALTVTAVDSRWGGYVTVYSCDRSRPHASSLNYGVRETVANTVLTELSSDGEVCVYNSAPIDLVIDVTGSFPASSGFDPLPPARLFDSRAGESTVDGRFVGGGLRGQGSLTKVDVVGRGSVSSDVGAVALTVTAVDSRWGGYVTVYSCDRSRPHASSLNYGVRETVANTVLTELSSDGEVCVYNSAPIDLVIDVTGSFPASSGFDPLPPARLFDSRAGESTVDGRFVGGGLRGQGSLTKVDVVGRGSVSSDVGAVALTVTAVDSRWGGYVTVYSCDRSRPHASSLNYGVRETVANTVLTELSSDGEVCVYNSAPIDLVIDVTGSFPA